MDDEDVDATERSTETLLYKCRKLANSFEFNLGIGTFSLTIGVIITAVTFQEHKDSSVVFLIGPVFIATGIVVMGRAVLFKFLKNHVTRRSRRRQRSGGHHRDDYTGHSRTENCAADPCYADDPPPYEAAIATSTSNIGVSQITIATTLGSVTDEPLPPPPSYEEAIQHPPVLLPEPTSVVTR